MKNLAYNLDATIMKQFIFWKQTKMRNRLSFNTFVQEKNQNYAVICGGKIIYIFLKKTKWLKWGIKFYVICEFF